MKSRKEHDGGPVRAIAMVLAGKCVVVVPDDRGRDCYIEDVDTGFTRILEREEAMEVAHYALPVRLIKRIGVEGHLSMVYGTKKGRDAKAARTAHRIN